MTYKLPLKYAIYILAVFIFSGIYQLFVKFAPTEYIDTSNLLVWFLNSLFFIGVIVAFVYFIEKKKLLEHKVPIALAVSIVAVGFLIDCLMV